MYTSDAMLESIKKVEATRPSRVGVLPERLTAEQKEEVLSKFHPDYKQEGFSVLQVGPNKGEKVPTELAALLQANSRVKDLNVDLSKVDYDVDVLVIGGGGAGSYHVHVLPVHLFPHLQQYLRHHRGHHPLGIPEPLLRAGAL